jgi:membrane protein DedA with SNARE-associated domain
MDFLAVFSLDQVERWFEWGGYFILFGLLFACGLGLPLPEDIPLLLGGYFVALGRMNIVWVGVLAWLGIIGGDCCLYWLSRRYGMGITNVRFIGTHVTKDRILWAQGKFEKYGVWVVAICRLFAGVRGAMVIAAGVVRFNFVKFVIADGLAALVSGGLFVILGWYAGKRLGTIGQMRESIKHYEHYVVIGILAAVALFVLYLWWRRKKHRTLADAAFEAVVEHPVERLEQRRGHGHGTRAEGSNDAPGGPHTPRPAPDSVVK